MTVPAAILADHREPPPERPAFLSEAECRAMTQLLTRSARGGGYTGVLVVSAWVGNVRWARNQITTSGEVRNNHVVIARDINGAMNCTVGINDTSLQALIAAERRAERLAQFDQERREWDLLKYWNQEPYSTPQLFVPATYQQDAEHRADAARTLMQSSKDAGMLSAGYIEVSAHNLAWLGSWGYARSVQYTSARYSITVRDPKGISSGWAGVDWPDWNKIDGTQLSAIALEKCLQSRNPVAIEPGRYTTILEPQAVSDFAGQLVRDDYFGVSAFTYAGHPMHATSGQSWNSKLGQRVIDERITITADPADLGIVPFSIKASNSLRAMSWINQEYYHPVTWIDQGVLKNLSANRHWMETVEARNTGLPNSGAFRMSVVGETKTVQEMIAATKRGVLVTRFDQVERIDWQSTLYRGYTRDGVWLIENGALSKPVKNMVFTESVLFALNNVKHTGVPQRVFHPGPNDENEFRAVGLW